MIPLVFYRSVSSWRRSSFMPNTRPSSFLADRPRLPDDALFAFPVREVEYRSNLISPASKSICCHSSGSTSSVHPPAGQIGKRHWMYWRTRALLISTILKRPK